MKLPDRILEILDQGDYALVELVPKLRGHYSAGLATIAIQRHLERLQDAGLVGSYHLTAAVDDVRVWFRKP